MTTDNFHVGFIKVTEDQMNGEV